MSDDYTAVMGNVVKHRSMADGTIRVEVDLVTPDDETYELAVTKVARVGAPLALARLSQEAAANHQAQGVQKQAEEEEPPSYGDKIALLYRSGSLRAPAVLLALGADRLYQDWCREQVCVVCGGWDYDPDSAIHSVEYAHVRRANNSGTALKPEYSGVPMCHHHHHVQHNQGEAECLNEWHYGEPFTPDEAKQWFDRKVVEHLERWSHERLRQIFEVDHLKHVPPEQIADWFHHHDLGPYLPRGFEE